MIHAAIAFALGNKILLQVAGLEVSKFEPFANRADGHRSCNNSQSHLVNLKSIRC